MRKRKVTIINARKITTEANRGDKREILVRTRKVVIGSRHETPIQSRAISTTTAKYSNSQNYHGSSIAVNDENSALGRKRKLLDERRIFTMDEKRSKVENDQRIFCASDEVETGTDGEKNDCEISSPGAKDDEDIGGDVRVFLNEDVSNENNEEQPVHENDSHDTEQLQLENKSENEREFCEVIENDNSSGTVETDEIQKSIDDSVNLVEDDEATKSLENKSEVEETVIGERDEDSKRNEKEEKAAEKHRNLPEQIDLEARLKSSEVDQNPVVAVTDQKSGNEEMKTESKTQVGVKKNDSSIVEVTAKERDKKTTALASDSEDETSGNESDSSASSGSSHSSSSSSSRSSSSRSSSDSRSSSSSRSDTDTEDDTRSTNDRKSKSPSNSSSYSYSTDGSVEKPILRSVVTRKGNNARRSRSPRRLPRGGRSSRGGRSPRGGRSSQPRSFSDGRRYRFDRRENTTSQRGQSPRRPYRRSPRSRLGRRDSRSPSRHYRRDGSGSRELQRSRETQLNRSSGRTSSGSLPSHSYEKNKESSLSDNKNNLSRTDDDFVEIDVKEKSDTKTERRLQDRVDMNVLKPGFDLRSKLRPKKNGATNSVEKRRGAAVRLRRTVENKGNVVEDQMDGGMGERAGNEEMSEEYTDVTRVKSSTFAETVVVEEKNSKEAQLDAKIKRIREMNEEILKKREEIEREKMLYG